MAALSAVVLAACAPAGPRISQHRATFDGLSSDERTLIEQGRISTGMPRDAVIMAWGTPERRKITSLRGRPAEVWIYVGHATTMAGQRYAYGPRGEGSAFIERRRSQARIYDYAHMRHPMDRLFYDPFFPLERLTYPSKTVSFQDGRVIGYQIFRHPRAY